MRLLLVFIALHCFYFGHGQVSHIHWGSTNNALSGVTLSWLNTANGDSIRWGYSLGLEKGSYAAIPRTFHSKYLHDYTFPALQENTNVYYSIYSKSAQLWLDTLHYSTPQTGESFTFTAMGDSRTYWADWQKVSQSVLPSDFTIFMGDIVTSGGSLDDWNNWFSYGNSYLQENMVFHCVGNHELRNDAQGLNYKALFSHPGEAVNEQLYYSFTHKNAMFICLNSENPADEIQYKWLLNKLEASQNYEWVVVWFHRPFFTYPSHIGEMNAYIETWWKAFDDYGVDLIFNGHTHNYQRTVPINLNVRKDSMVSLYGKCTQRGRCQIVTGGAGAPPVDEGIGWFVNETYKGNHFVHVEVFSDSLIIKALTPNHEIIDSFSIVRDFKPGIKGDFSQVCLGETVSLSGYGASEYEWSSNLNNGVPFKPDTTKEYMMIAYDSTGCIDTVYAEVEVLPSYSFYDTLSICNGDSIYWQNRFLKLGSDYVEWYHTQEYCDSSYSLNLKVYKKPDDFSISGAAVAESWAVEEYKVWSDEDLEFSWEVENGTIVGSEGDSLVQIEWGNDTLGYIFATGVNNNGCSNKMEFQVQLNNYSKNKDDLATEMLIDITNQNITCIGEKPNAMMLFNVLGSRVLYSNRNEMSIENVKQGVYVLVLSYNQTYSKRVKIYKP